MAKRKKNVEVTKIEKPLLKLNATFNDMLDKISSSSNKRDEELTTLMRMANDIIDGEVDGLDDMTGGDISTFIVKVFNELENFEDSINKISSIDDLFNAKDGSVLDLFKARYRNRNYLLEDLAVIYDQLYELEEAVMTTRDAIITSDDVSQTVARTIKLKNDTDTEANSSYISMIEQMEKDLKLFMKIKDHIVPKTLQFGSYYAYTVPYSKIFSDMVINKSKEKERLMESFTLSELTVFGKENDKMKKELDSIVENYSIHENVSAILTENSNPLKGLSNDEFEKVVRRKMKTNTNPKNNNTVADGTLDTNSIKKDFENVTGCYFELIHPKKIVPVRILEQTLGYYYIIDSDIATSSNLEINRHSAFTSMNANINKEKMNKHSDENVIISSITDKIVKSFNKPFLEENRQFKDLMANTLLYDQLYKKKLRFIYIPAEYMTEFKVNEDERGEGTSMLIKSLFNAKLYLALLIFKMLSILSSSNDTKMFYIKQGIDKNVSNKIQDVARAVKAKELNFNDLLDYPSMVSKVGKGKNIYLPIGQSGERGIEFDVMAGQDIQLNTEYMDMFRNGYINATGVPSVIMNYINEADYAKTLVMANSKFLGRVVSYQLNFNSGLTELYRKLARFTLPMGEDVIETIEYACVPPKSLNNMNLTDMINNAEQTILYMIKSVTGENSNVTEDDNHIKDMMFDKLSRELLPMLPWEKCDEMLKEARLELQNHKYKKPDTQEE